jgi:hypothetical protein
VQFQTPLHLLAYLGYSMLRNFWENFKILKFD